MMVPAEYLRAARLDELAGKYKQEGYDVRVHTPEGFDLIAVKNGKRIVIQVQARATRPIRERGRSVAPTRQ